MVLLSAALATLALPRAGWLDRAVHSQKEKLFNEIRELAPININAEIRPKPEGYEDSDNWDYDSVIRLLTLIRGSETAKPVHKALRRMLQPTRRLMMSIKESMHRFPSIKKGDNALYYDEEYTNLEEGNLPAPPAVPEDQVVLVVSNPVEARLPSARISVKLLRPWVEFIKNSSTEASTVTDVGGHEDAATAADAGGNATTVEGAPGDGATTEVEDTTKVEDTTEVKDTTAVEDTTEVIDTTEVADTTEVKNTTEVADTTEDTTEVEPTTEG